MDISGLAAWAAAATSAATLVVTTMVSGRREHHRWIRDALTEAFVAFLEASWRHSDLARAADAGEPLAEGLLSEYREMRKQLTRLRLLATDGVIGAGEVLLQRQQDVHEAPVGAQREQALAAASLARRTVLAAAKKEMGLL
ncbi:hypothetical protein [Streptomyces sp. NPDC051997]|uniref:hypothetical protein n=1 Tax=Streptomyces sp. NPDC051997 TaxID=3155611 RepID=UPI00342A6FC7